MNSEGKKSQMDKSRILGYGLPIVGVLLLSVSIGGVVLGSYAAIQEDTGRCGNPLIHITPPEQTGPLSGSSTEGPGYVVLDFQDLTPNEQRAFREGLNKADNIGKAEDTLYHLSEFENGAIVIYEGDRYYVTLHGENTCIGIAPFVLPLSILGALVGFGMVVTPPIWSLLSTPNHQNPLDEITDPRIVFLGGRGDFWVFVAFNIAIILGLLHWIGLLIGAALVGLTTSTTERAAVLSVYLGCIVTILFSIYDYVISTLVGVPSVYPGGAFSILSMTMSYPSFVTAIPLAVFAAVVIRIVTRARASSGTEVP
jgi:hypothetical protein